MSWPPAVLCQCYDPISEDLRYDSVPLKSTLIYKCTTGMTAAVTKCLMFVPSWVVSWCGVFFWRRYMKNIWKQFISIYQYSKTFFEFVYFHFCLCGTFPGFPCEFYVKNCLTQIGLLWDFEKPLLQHSLPRRLAPNARHTQVPCHVRIMNSDSVETQISAKGANFLRLRFLNRFSSVFYVVRSFGMVWCSSPNKYVYSSEFLWKPRRLFLCSHL